LLRSIPGLTERMLIRHLKDLVSDGILIRKPEKGTHPRVVYSISEYGMTMLPVLEYICAWGRKHMERRKVVCAVR
jgi:DNA-binding HxlR family transcriptional regulator